ncbi:hypothetical protein FXB40_42630 [Bradyrhizobium rifense]|uniref:Uncharacterized protein n=1 Tax=Bradyrhizobium rifense TaxID=515499 RepID=A0A5D3KAZ6_9BRAD|nr:hypothetical protein [Bradyrhizobium rifense]TYL86003.1 hypothetical protein FXB40_42630 [Bradyrhizobium rifense]
MGVSISLLFVRGRQIADILAGIDLATTGEHRSAPLNERGAFVMVALPSGFDLIWSNTCDERRFSTNALADLSAGSEVIVLAVEEHVMFSQAEVWRDGRQIWALQHNGDVDATNLELSGDLPPLFDTLCVEQKDLAVEHQDFFDIPVKLVADITGFRYDQNYDWETADTYTVLAVTASASATRPFWKFW